MAKKETAKERREKNRAATLAKRLNKPSSTKKYAIDDTYDDSKKDASEVSSIDDVTAGKKILEDFTVKPNHSNDVPLYKQREALVQKLKAFCETQASLYDDEPKQPSEEEERHLKILEKNERKRRWQKKMPEHEMHEVPEFLIDPSLQSERKKVAERLEELLKTKFSLSDIADIFIYNDYDHIDSILSSKQEILRAIKKEYPAFASKFKEKVGENNSKLYSAQENRVKALIDFLKKGSFTKSYNIYAFKDAVSSVVDMPAFNTACQIESGFICGEIEIFLSEMEQQKTHELYELRSRAMALRYELQYRNDAYQTISELVNGKSNEELDR